MISFKRVLQSGAIALTLAGSAMGMTGTASAQDGYYDNDPNRDGYNGRDGYYNGNPYNGDYHNQGGYYNNDPNRGYYNDRYDNGRHGRRGNDALSILFGSIAFGYRDGYWDNGHRWHHWRHDRDYRDYRDHGGNYHGWNHDRDDDNGWRGR